MATARRKDPTIVLWSAHGMLRKQAFFLCFNALVMYWLISFGVGLITPMITAIALQSIGPERGGMISAIVNFFRQISGAFGVAVFGVFITDENSGISYRYFRFSLITIACLLIFSIWLFYRINLRQNNLKNKII